MVVDNIKRAYTFLNPFNVYNKKEKMLLVSKKDIKELTDSKKDVFSLIYKPVGLTNNDFISDSSNGVKIITFRTDNGDYIDIPERYVKISDTTFSGIEYESNILAFKLGPLPTTEDLTTLMNDIKTIIDSRLGIVCNAKIMKNSAKTLVSKTDHDLFTIDRKSKMNSVSLYSKYIECQTRRDKLEQFIQELILYNKNNC